MKTFTITILLFWLAAPTLHAVNVRDFGAAGDGSTDDTLAIQRAATAATANRGMAHEEIFFPPGTYLISDTIVIRNHAPQCLSLVNLRGDRATIRQSDPAKDIIYFEESFRHTVEGLDFDGGRRQLKFWSNNIDSGHVTIRNCRFANAASFAVDDSLRKDTGNTENWLAVLKPAEVIFQADGKAEVVWADEEAYPPFYFTSTQLRITECEFRNNRKAFFVTSDWAFVDRTRIETSPEQEGAAIVSLGGLHLEDVEGLARVTPGKEQYWIQKLDCMNQYGVNFRNVRLASDAETGWAVVHNYCRHGGNQNSAFFFDQCNFAVAGSPENSILWLHEIPNLIHFQDTAELSGRSVDAVGFARDFTEKDLQNDPEKLSYRIDGNNTNLRNTLPAWMAHYTDPALPGPARQAIREFPVSRPLTGHDFPSPGKSYRIPPGASADVIQGILDQAAAEAALAEVVIPAGHYPLDRSLRLPPRIHLRGEGTPIIYAAPGMTEAAFTGAGVEQIRLEHLYLTNLAAGITLTTRPENEAKILVRDCTFDRLNGWALAVVSGDGTLESSNRTAVTLADSTVTFTPALTHNAAAAVIDNTWITSDASLEKTGSIRNYGTLYMRGMLGVPETDLAGKFHGQRTGRTTANDHRWIDNYGRIYIDRCRFGGESGGFPMVVNYAEDGEIILRESWCYIYEGNPERLTLLDFERIPALAVLLNNMGWPVPAVMATVRPGNPAGEIPGRVLFESGNVPATRIKDMR